MSWLLIAAGLALLALGGDVLVRGAVGVAEKLRVSPLLTGLVLVGFGTSTPELVTSLNAAMKDSPAIAVGNVVGSNIANILLILGLAAVIAPVAADRRALKRDGPMLALATLLCTGAALTGNINRPIGVIFLALLLGYILFTYTRERRVYDAQAALHARETELAQPHTHRWLTSLALSAGGIARVILGAEWMVDGSMAIARAAGVPEVVLGLTIVAVGTSLPELATSVIAAIKRQADIALGNIVGSNIFNILGILGVTALIQPFRLPTGLVTQDVWIMVAATALLLWLVAKNAGLGRGPGVLFLALYAAYLALLGVRAMAGS